MKEEVFHNRLNDFESFFKSGYFRGRIKSRCLNEQKDLKFSYVIGSLVRNQIPEEIDFRQNFRKEYDEKVCQQKNPETIRAN